MTLEAGTQLGHYRIVGLLGRGGMADVYRAEDERLGREVALKTLPPEFAREPDRVVRFEREVHAAAKLTHSGIVTVYEYGQSAGQHFYTMALMPGGDLKARIRRHPDGMPPAEACRIAAAIAGALAYAHGRGIVHRDVKPENILFDASDDPQLTDFGIARAVSEGTRMTATGTSIGSPHYMSPEQARGLVVDGRGDAAELAAALALDSPPPSESRTRLMPAARAASPSRPKAPRGPVAVLAGGVPASALAGIAYFALRGADAPERSSQGGGSALGTAPPLASAPSNGSRLEGMPANPLDFLDVPARILP